MRTPLRSSALSSMDYDPQSQSLTITFHGGRSYTYANVPQDVADDLQNAPSPGTYWRDSIKDQYG